MRVLHISTHDTGGAGEAVCRIHDSMLEQGVDSRFLCLYSMSGREGVASYAKFSPVRNFYHKVGYRLRSMLRRHDPNYYFFDNGTYAINEESELWRSLGEFRPDKVIFYWISGFINPRVIHQVSSKVEVSAFWYLTDMAPLTGGCHYAWTCEGFKSSCGRCPALFSGAEEDQSKKNLQLKLELLGASDITIITPNSFVTNQVKASSVFGESRISEIYFGIDSDFFEVGDKERARIALSLPVDKKLVFFGASNINEKRKGFEYLLEALTALEGSFEKSEVMIVSAGSLDTATLNLNFEQKHFGPVDYPTLRDLYVAADVVVVPSVEDSGPLMTSEVLMTGTPVVAFDTGIASELVSNRTGYLARLYDSDDLEAGVRKILLLSNNAYADVCANCRSIAATRLGKTKVTKDLFALLTNVS